MADMTATEWAALLVETSVKHHDAYTATDGFDPDWPRWYAEYLVAALDGRVRPDDLERLVIAADQAFRDQDLPFEEWPAFYGTYLADHIGPGT